MSLPRVYSAISAITAAFAHHGLPKERINLDEGYAYRAIDEVVERLAPLLAEHKLCILPRVLERTQGERIDSDGEALIHVILRVAFDLVSVEDGSSHTIEGIGEALDHGDKASAKAMTSAYKHGVLHAFCIPTSGREDPDRSSPCRSSSGRGSVAAVPAPVEGWAQWADDIAAVVESCVAPEAIERLLASNRSQLSALAREQPDAYSRIGRAIATRRKVLAQPVAPIVTGEAPGSPEPVEGSVIAKTPRGSRGRRRGPQSKPARIEPRSGISPAKPAACAVASGTAGVAAGVAAGRAGTKATREAKPARAKPAAPLATVEGVSAHG